MTHPDALRTAGIVTRGVAAIVDLFFVALVIGALYLGLTLAMLMLHPTALTFPALGIVFSSAMVLVVSVVYLAGCWSVSGCTVGAVAMGLRVIRRGGAHVTPVIALLRAIACVLFPIGLLWVAVDQRRRSLQDIVLGTRVVYVRP